MLIRLYFLQDVFVFVLSVEIEASHHLLEKVDVNNLVSFATSKTKGLVEKDLKCFYLIL